MRNLTDCANSQTIATIYNFRPVWGIKLRTLAFFCLLAIGFMIAANEGNYDSGK
jgi:hypothetical protein